MSFLERKLKTYFKRADFDHDGVLTKKDYDGMADRCAHLLKLDAKKAADVKAKYIQVWEQYIKGSTSDGKSLSEAQFIENVKKRKADPEFKDKLKSLFSQLFHIIDANGDNQIQHEEFEIFFETRNIDPKLAKASFDSIDTNSDGVLSLEEFTHAGVDFFTSEDEHNPSKLFLGPLV